MVPERQICRACTTYGDHDACSSAASLRLGVLAPGGPAYPSELPARTTKEPTYRTLLRLLAAAGVELRPQSLAAPSTTSATDSGGLQQLLVERRAEILKIADAYGASDVQVFGSIARGDHTEDRDVDLLVDLPPRRVLLNVAGLAERLSELLGVRVDVTTPRLLRADVAPTIARDAVPL